MEAQDNSAGKAGDDVNTLLQYSEAHIFPQAELSKKQPTNKQKPNPTQTQTYSKGNLDDLNRYKKK